jgi:hypothetical protein
MLSINCLLRNEHLTLFFYVDDIIILYSKRYFHALQAFERALLRCFEIRPLRELKWFLGICVIRDRSARKLWPCQDLYIAKIAAKFNLDGEMTSTAQKTLLSTAELLLNDAQATAQQIFAY